MGRRKDRTEGTLEEKQGSDTPRPEPVVEELPKQELQQVETATEETILIEKRKGNTTWAFNLDDPTLEQWDNYTSTFEYNNQAFKRLWDDHHPTFRSNSEPFHLLTEKAKQRTRRYVNYTTINYIAFIKQVEQAAETSQLPLSTYLQQLITHAMGREHPKSASQTP